MLKRPVQKNKHFISSKKRADKTPVVNDEARYRLCGQKERAGTRSEPHVGRSPAGVIVQAEARGETRSRARRAGRACVYATYPRESTLTADSSRRVSSSHPDRTR